MQNENIAPQETFFVSRSCLIQVFDFDYKPEEFEMSMENKDNEDIK